MTKGDFNESPALLKKRPWHTQNRWKERLAVAAPDMPVSNTRLRSSTTNNQIHSTEANTDRRKFPVERRVARRPIDTSKSLEELKEWMKTEEIKMEPLAPQDDEGLEDGPEALRQGDLGPATALIEHRTMLKEGTPVFRAKPKRIAPDKEWWLVKYAIEGLENGMFESTVAANGEPSKWNATCVIVREEGKPQPRLTFNYYNV
ncbi:hypothetical protein AC579_1878 [Pseudocercospora musae]|uniref:Uncharacterized protein n=1 Tax=Pseudocercospora musae TaxID=113226 RepID=A0A139HZC0_9PEZI|nr:hypothetical protein AC579_1878 [Pseudocercospora musae]